MPYDADVAKAALAAELAYAREKLMKPIDKPGPVEYVAGAVKYDSGKAPVMRGCFRYFHRALEAVANVSAYGFSKYKGWGGWRKVDNAEERYQDALVRHMLSVAGGLRSTDPETNLYHLAHVAWNALALLDMVIAADDGRQRQFTPYIEPAHDPKDQSLSAAIRASKGLDVV